MQKTDVRVDTLDDLAIELHDETKNAVRSRMLRSKVNRVIADLLVARVAYVTKIVAEFDALARRAKVDFHDPAGRLGPGVGHDAPPVLRRLAPLGLGAGPPFRLLTSSFAFLARGLRACRVAALSAGLPAPVSEGPSVVFLTSAAVFALWVDVPPGAGAGEGAPGASPVAF